MKIVIFNEFEKIQTNVLESIDTNKCLLYDINIFKRE